MMNKIFIIIVTEKIAEMKRKYFKSGSATTQLNQGKL